MSAYRRDFGRQHVKVGAGIRNINVKIPLITFKNLNANLMQ